MENTKQNDEKTQKEMEKQEQLKQWVFDTLQKQKEMRESGK